MSESNEEFKNSKAVYIDSLPHCLESSHRISACDYELDQGSFKTDLIPGKHLFTLHIEKVEKNNVFEAIKVDKAGTERIRGRIKPGTIPKTHVVSYEVVPAEKAPIVLLNADSQNQPRPTAS